MGHDLHDLSCRKMAGYAGACHLYASAVALVGAALCADPVGFNPPCTDCGPPDILTISASMVRPLARGAPIWASGMGPRSVGGGVALYRSFSVFSHCSASRARSSHA